MIFKDFWLKGADKFIYFPDHVDRGSPLLIQDPDGPNVEIFGISTPPEVPLPVATPGDFWPSVLSGFTASLVLVANCLPAERGALHRHR